MSTQNQPLVDQSAREVSMFGALAFMINEKLLVAVDKDGDLLVRADPARNAELLALRGTKQAEMGAGRSMGPSWIRVGRGSVVADDDLFFWIEVAREYNARARKATT